MSELGVSEPGGFLAELQRTRCKGDSALTTYQGMRFDEIIVPKSADDAAEDFVDAVNEYAALMQDELHFLPGEFAAEASCSYYAHTYVTQAAAGGHAEYWANRSDDVVAIRCAAQGLKSMLADPYHDVFVTMTRLMNADQKTVRRLLKQKRWRNVEAGLRALDDKLKDLVATEPLAPRQRTWLKSLRKLRIIGDHETGTYRSAFETANPLRARRHAERDRLRAEREKSDPTYRTVRALCDMGRMRFMDLGDGSAGPMRAIWPEGPNRRGYVRRVLTNQGDRAAVFYREGGLFKTYLAVLLEEGGALPLGSLTLTREEYETIVPAYARR
ncbi:MAG TPA: hypothetical protein PLN53_07260 [Terricaulis sp.]|nr:hypothetical protein [Terricaulis sp.]